MNRCVEQILRIRKAAAGIPTCRSQRAAVDKQGRLPVHKGKSSPAIPDALFGSRRIVVPPEAFAPRLVLFHPTIV
jgi:hypothetical protein